MTRVTPAPAIAAGAMDAPREAADWTTLSLAPGKRVQVEASAGTGKTWTIAALYLRLLLEATHGGEPIGVRRVLVATFSNAAAAELRERLRRRLTGALHLAEAGASATPADADAADRWLLARWQQDAAQRARDATRLAVALAEFDRAPVLTLHAACHRVLREHPFEARMRFDVGELEDGVAMLEAIADDLWRAIQQGATQQEATQQGSIRQDDIGPGTPGDEPALERLRAQRDRLVRETLHRQVEILLRPGATVALASWPPTPAQAPTPEPGEIAAMLACADGDVLDARSVLRRGWRTLAAWLQGESIDWTASLLDDLQKIDGPRVQAAAAKHPELQHLITRTCTVWLPWLRQALESRPALAPDDLLAVQAVARRLRQRHQAARDAISYDDLIVRVHDLLLGEEPAASALADALFAAWPIALVDEFQDTDPFQYAILDRLYRNARDGAPRGWLALIGDPKQAIYRFRGGDIHTYLRATAAVAERLTLHVNQRSTPAYVAACNAFYAACGTSFRADDDDDDDNNNNNNNHDHDAPRQAAAAVTPAKVAEAATEAVIRYRPVEASARHADAPLRRDGTVVDAPLVLHLLAGAPVSQSARVERALQACAGHIAAVLDEGRHGIGARPLDAGDIAVLLPEHKHVLRLQALLAARGVAVACVSRQSVFATDTARDLLCLLHAIWHDTDRGAVRAALGTRLWGVPFGAIDPAADASTWPRDLAFLRHCRALWQHSGVNAAVLALASRLATRLLAATDGERRLTDLRHLGELLQAREASVAGAEEVLAWLRDGHAHAAGDEATREATQQRIESDQPRVRLMTLHASKGLEFPLVWLPILWQGPRAPEKQALVTINAADGSRRLRSDAVAHRQEGRERQEEQLRLAYVALTRATHGSHVFALDPARPRDGKAKAPPVTAIGVERSALDVLLQRLLHRQGQDYAALAAHARIAHVEIRAGWPEAAAAADGRAVDAAAVRVPTPQLRPLPAPATQPLPARHSFTSLLRRAAYPEPGQDAPADDERLDADTDTALLAAGPADAETRTPHRELDALATVAGADFGDALHAILERRAFDQPLSRQLPLVREQLLAAGVRAAGLDPGTLAERVARRLQAMLDAPLGTVDGPRLAALPASAQRAEMGFDYILDGATLARLAQACAALGEPELVPAHADALHGLMTGKIDLVFEHAGRVHVLDYKSNRLGEAHAQCLGDYRGTALDAAMQAHGYRFQALLYTVALERYLRQRLGERYRREHHLGEAWYLFVRAVGLPGVADPSLGVWRHRFDAALLDAVQAELSVQATSAAPSMARPRGVA